MTPRFKSPPLEGQISQVQPALLRRLNESKVFEVLQTHGPLSRADLTRYTGISAPTVSKTVAALIEAQLLEEGEWLQPALGRPARLVGLACRQVQVLGLVIGAQQCELVSAGLDGSLDATSLRMFPTPRNYDALLDACFEQVQALLTGRRVRPLGLGMSLPGLFDYQAGRTLVSPNLHQLDGHQLGLDLEKRLGLTTSTIQEIHALCLSERTYGAARQIEHFAVLDLHEGLGLGVVSKGQQVLGQAGLAGELGHLTVDPAGRLCGCGNRGCLETLACDAALARLVSERLGKPMTIDEVITTAHAGELDIRHELELLLRYLGIALGAVVNLFNPQAIFLHCRFLDANNTIFTDLLEQVRLRALAPSLAGCRIVRGQGSKRLGAVGAAIRQVTTGKLAVDLPQLAS